MLIWLISEIYITTSQSICEIMYREMFLAYRPQKLVHSRLLLDMHVSISHSVKYSESAFDYDLDALSCY